MSTAVMALSPAAQMPDDGTPADFDSRLRSRPLAHFSNALPPRVVRALQREGIATVGQLAALSDRDLTLLPNVGPVGRKAIVAFLTELGVARPALPVPVA